YYRCYRCAAGKYISVGALETQFFTNLWRTLMGTDMPDHMDMSVWPDIRKAFEDKFAQKDRDEWTRLFAGKDACVIPVLAPDEVWSHPHIAQRHADTSPDNVPVIPRFGGMSMAPPKTDTTDKSDEILAAAGLTPEQIALASPESERNRIPSRTWPPKMTLSK